MHRSRRRRAATQRNGRAVFALRATCFAVAVASAGGLLLIDPSALVGAQASTAAIPLTVNWVDDSSTAQEFQPPRDTENVHHSEFDDISVTVSQTTNLTDQALVVDVAGFAGTREATDSGGMYWSTAQNFVQAMQCWGEDPLAADFAETCQWGGRYAANNGLGDTVYSDVVPRLATADMAPGGSSTIDNPFRTVQGTMVTAKQIFGGVGMKESTYPLLNYFSPATTNEVQGARINSDGTGSFLFETQSSDQAPQLGCGSEDHARCWLVLVPRGTHYSGPTESGTNEGCSGLIDAKTEKPYVYGRANSIQAGSPVNAQCDYWANRINIPLDFDPTGQTCAVGSSERRTIGSQLMVGAMSSWQASLCQEQGAAFSFSSNPDALARAQLLQGQADAGFLSWPLSDGEAEYESDKEMLAATELSYAPVAVTAPVVAFVAEFANGRQEELTVSPRLMAKLLTQSYTFAVPSNSSDPDKNFAHLNAVNRSYQYLNEDPEFRQLNPNNWRQFTMNPSISLPGPSGADAIKQVWRWILADDEASSWLTGEADENGMKVNPFYLPAGHADAQVPVFITDLADPDQGDYLLDESGAITMRPVGLKSIAGTGFSLTDAALETFMKADESLVPIKLNAEKYRFDSLQYAPYAESLLTASRDTFRGDSHSKTVWDATRINAAGELGDWISGGTQIPGKKFMIALTDASSSSRYGLSNAGLVRANSDEAVLPTNKTMQSALGALSSAESATVRQVDPSLVTTGGYPLTMLTYLAVNLTASDVDGRGDYAGMIDQVTTAGQVVGTQRGELPLGYAPLSDELVSQAKAAAAAIRAFINPVVDSPTAIPSPDFSVTTTTSTGPAQDDYFAGEVADASVVPVADAAGAGLDTTALPATVTDRTPELVNAAGVGKTALALSLGLGLSGAVFAPTLLRGRRLLTL
ncbi:hypothetical protein D6T64_17370 [Cryobacterium melibiosiphilum]|uniref:PBP domain-containing protein n=1 Tax=Cryobacterium melibiosiphilum TaxID=995039 RepID=A0A3A5MDT0_9MICO|nr:hypothetical protein [Cryobacterium melibiosiphilum]RJT86901.1 hypothetical protein D6T64_17370 [Cryobacterium melibiosiphilum]